MTNKNMYEVSKAITDLDPNLNKESAGADKKWHCTSDGATTATTSGTYGKCKKDTGSSGVSLMHAFTGKDSDTSALDGDTAKNIPVRITSSDFTRDDKAKISSAFAKAHEGVEIVIAVDIHQ